MASSCFIDATMVYLPAWRPMHPKACPPIDAILASLKHACDRLVQTIVVPWGARRVAVCAVSIVPCPSRDLPRL